MMRLALFGTGSTPGSGTARLILLAIGLLLPLTTLVAQSQSVRAPPASKPLPPSKDEMIATAAAIVKASKAMSRIWPGYWPEGQAFIINVDGTGALLVSQGAKPAAFAPISSDGLPPELKGRAFFHDGVLGGAQRPFVIDYPIGEGKKAILVNARDRDALKTTGLILHEQFHGYQGTAFKGKGEGQFVGPLAVKDRVAFAATAELERSILIAVLSEKSAGERRRLVQQYFAVRRERERTVAPEVVQVEQGFERLEGTASYAEKAGLTALGGGGDGELRRRLMEQLDKKPASDGAFTTVWFRGRSYSTGAALTYLIGCFDRGAWQAKIEGGAKPDQILEALVGPVPARKAAFMAEAARERFGYEAKRRELGPVIRAAERAEIKSIPEFLALQPYHVVFEPGSAGAAARPGFSATNMVALSPTTMALPKALVFNVADKSFSLTVRDRPMLLEFPTRFTVLLPAPPMVSGRGILPPGEHRLQSLQMSADGYELKVETPVTIRVEPHRMVVRLNA